MWYAPFGPLISISNTAKQGRCINSLSVRVSIRAVCIFMFFFFFWGRGTCSIRFFEILLKPKIFFCFFVFFLKIGSGNLSAFSTGCRVCECDRDCPAVQIVTIGPTQKRKKKKKKMKWNLNIFDAMEWELFLYFQRTRSFATRVASSTMTS